MLGRNIRPIGVVVAQCLGESFSRCLFHVLKKLGSVCSCSQTGIATCGAIFREKLLWLHSWNHIIRPSCCNYDLVLINGAGKA